MAVNTWNAAVDSDGNNVGNWSLGALSSSDTLTFDATSVAACNLSGNISCAAINITSAYSGQFDAVTHDITTTGDITMDGTTALLMGTGSVWTCAGNWDSYHQTLTRQTSSVVMTGTTKLLQVKSGTGLYDLQISGDIAASGLFFNLAVWNYFLVDAGKTFTAACYYGFYLRDFMSADIYGTVDISSGFKFYLRTQIDLRIKTGGRITGLGTLQTSQGSVGSQISEMAGTFDPALVIVNRGITLTGGVYGGDWTFSQNYIDKSIVLGTATSQTVEFTGDVSVDADKAGYSYTLDMATHDCDAKFSGDLTLAASAGTLVWSEGATSVVTFDGTGTLTDNAGVGTLGDVSIEGALTLGANAVCDDFATVSGGSFDSNGYDINSTGDMDWASGFSIVDPAGSTFDIDGNFTADTQTIVGSATWYMDIVGTAVVSGIGSVSNCDATGTGGTEVDASAGPWTDGLGNTNWNFGANIAIKAMHHQMQMAL